MLTCELLEGIETKKLVFIADCQLPIANLMNQPNRQLTIGNWQYL